MSIYNPDKWVMVKLVSPEYTIYKIMGSWYGGFAGSDSWKLSSGTLSQTDTVNGREYLQDSGSSYAVSKDNYGMSSYTTGVLSTFIEGTKGAEGVSIEVLTLEQTWELDPSVFGAWKNPTS